MKAAALKEAINHDDIQVFSGREYHYRSRMDFAFHADGLGLRERGIFHKFVDIEECLISNIELNRLLKEVREFFAGVFYFDVKKRFGAFCYAVLRTPPGDSSVSIVLNKNDRKLDRAQGKVREYAQISSANNVLITYAPYNRNVSVTEEYEVVKGRDTLSTACLEKQFTFPTQGFFQVNHEMTEAVHSYCQSLLSQYQTHRSHLWDLYGGVGTFGILSAGNFKEVTLVENSAASVKAAEENIRSNGVQNMETVTLDAKRLKELDVPSSLHIIIDPPRSGVHPKTLQRLAELTPEVLLYVSCNPKHLAHDLNELSRFQIKSAALFDMFPQTPHVETVIELIPK
jgi:tRNA/tmRNA/rRNA uracil-C5-methylase (TrmA/RlmC/RlmD family)